MNKRKLILVLLFYCVLTNGAFAFETGEYPLGFAPIPLSQSNLSLYKTRSTTYYPCASLRVGVMEVDIDHLNQHIEAVLNKTFAYNIPVVGLTYEFPMRFNGTGSFDDNIDLDYFIPQDLMQSNTQEAVLSGLSVGFGIGRDVFPGNRRFDLIVSSGFQAGLLRMRFANNLSNTPDDISSKYFLSPQLTVFPKLILGYVVVGLRAGYHIDVLSGEWTSSKYSADYGKSHMTGYTVEAVIGIQLGIYR